MRPLSMRLFITLLVFNLFTFLYGQDKQIAIEDIFKKRVFVPEMIHGMQPMADGKTYAVIEDSAINIYSYESGKRIRTMVYLPDLIPQETQLPIKLQSYQLSRDELKILIPTETESIYRHSTKSKYYVYDLLTKNLAPLSDHGKQQLATFSPDGKKVAFVRNNNLFIKSLSDGNELQITTDGELNLIINAATDWVYEEEFGFTKAFYWSNNSEKIAFYRFDESNVKEFQLTYYHDLYPEQYRYKYPKAGEENSIVSIHVFSVIDNTTTKMDMGSNADIYIPRIKWTENANLLSIHRLNRNQNHLEILLADVKTGTTSVLYEEKSPYYIDINDDLTFSPDSKHFILSSEKDGFNHLYLFKMNGTQIKQLTSGPWDITELYGVDWNNKQVFFQSAENSPLDRQIGIVNFKGERKNLIDEPGRNAAAFSAGFEFFVNTNSTANTPPYITIRNQKGKLIRVLITNNRLIETMKEFHTSEQIFFKFNHPNITLPNGDTTSLYGWKILPPNFDATKKYPVLLYIYGGPGSQTVNNAWGGRNYFWFQMLAQKGIIVISIDNRGTGARGSEFKKMTYKELGKYETEDMITTGRYLHQFDYVDSTKIAVFGWSYGGYMASLGITKGSDVFSTAIAVAPVTNWRYYDNIYTERYMQQPFENGIGYDDNSPINHVDKLRGNYLLIHGSADDNVHYQNTMEMINSLVSANKQFDLMIYPNKNHGIYGGNTSIHLYNKMTRFLLDHLLDE